MSPSGSYDPDAVRIMSEALRAAQSDLAKTTTFDPHQTAISKAMARRIMTAVAMGQRDPEVLVSLARQVIEGP